MRYLWYAKGKIHIASVQRAGGECGQLQLSSPIMRKCSHSTSGSKPALHKADHSRWLSLIAGSCLPPESLHEGLLPSGLSCRMPLSASFRQTMLGERCVFPTPRLWAPRGHCGSRRLECTRRWPEAGLSCVAESKGGSRELGFEFLAQTRCGYSGPAFSSLGVVPQWGCGAAATYENEKD